MSEKAQSVGKSMPRLWPVSQRKGQRKEAEGGFAFGSGLGTRSSAGRGTEAGFQGRIGTLYH